MAKALRVPEVWIYRYRQLKIYILQNGDYAESSVSPIFLDLPITEMIRNPNLIPSFSAIRKFGVAEQLDQSIRENFLLRSIG